MTVSVHIAFWGEHQPEKEVVEKDNREAARKLFNEVKQTAGYGGRKVLGIWVIDEGTEQGDVLDCWGRVPPKIHTLYRTRTGKPCEPAGQPE